MSKSKRITAESVVELSDEHGLFLEELECISDDIETQESEILDLRDEIKQLEEDVKELKKSIPARQKRVHEMADKLAERLAPIAYAHYPHLKRMRNLYFSASWLIGGNVCLSVCKKDSYECIEEISMSLDEFEAMLNGEELNAIIDSEIQELQAKIKELEARKS